MTHHLYYGDNLDVLRRKIRDETVDLCYIDPPFNSKRSYLKLFPDLYPCGQRRPGASMGTKNKTHMQQLTLLSSHEIAENPAFLSTQLITYIGNKRALLPFIGNAFRKVQQRLGRSQLSIFDMFSGTGVVARYCKKIASHLSVNDLESYSEVTNRCYLSNVTKINQNELAAIYQELVASIQDTLAPGFITELYSPRDENNIQAGERVFYTRRNAMYLDTARQQIESLPDEIKVYFLAPLIARASVHANTAGVFKGFYKNHRGVGQYGGNGKDALTRIRGDIQLDFPCFSHFECPFTVYREEANPLARRMSEVDVAYFDPPYNQHPYGSNYFMLNLLVDYQRPEKLSTVSGIPFGWNRSRYNQRAEAAMALFDLIETCPARFILISYNSEGFIPHDRFLKGLGQHGRYEVCETPYNTFRGSRNLRERALHVKEYLYLLEKK